VATDGPTPPHCDREVFNNGETIAIAHGKPNAMERWVKAVAKQADARLDWHYSGGLANILILGDDAARQRAEQAIRDLESELDGELHRIVPAGGPQLYRKGVTPVPEGTIAVATHPSGDSEVIVRD